MWLGHREVTPNRSPRIDEWIARCGLDPVNGYPWCAAFASWCVSERVSGLSTVQVKEPGALKLGGLFDRTVTPEPGDLMFFPVDTKGAGHVGIVENVSNLEVLCIEGNSENSVRRVRRLRSEVWFSRTRDEVWLHEPWPNAPLVRVQKAGTR